MDSPKSRFLKHPNASRMADVLASPDFLNACETALLQMEYGNVGSSDMTDAARLQLKREGARSFMYELINLCVPYTPPKRTTKDNLEP